jgi:acyl carrier protein
MIMNDRVYTTVCNTLGNYLQIPPRQVTPEHDLRADWGLDSLDLDIIASLIEEEEEVEIRSEDMSLIHNVGQLVRLVRALRARSQFELHLMAANDTYPRSRRRPHASSRR